MRQVADIGGVALFGGLMVILLVPTAWALLDVLVEWRNERKRGTR